MLFAQHDIGPLRIYAGAMEIAAATHTTHIAAVAIEMAARLPGGEPRCVFRNDDLGRGLSFASLQYALQFALDEGRRIARTHAAESLKTAQAARAERADGEPSCASSLTAAPP